MSKQNRAVANRFQNAATFYEHLKLALEFYDQPTILNQFSPLAEPYFLYLPSEEAESTSAEIDWGQVLRTRLLDAAAALWDGAPPADNSALLDGVNVASRSGDRYHFLVLELNYFKRIYTPAPRSQSDVYNNVLHIGRTTHDRHLREAVEALSDLLLKQLRPTLRLETPERHATLIGRQQLVAQCVSMLAPGQSLALVGAGGMGKTTLGAHLFNDWQQEYAPTVRTPRPLFWLTIRPGFNDRLSSLLFALGYFLHQHGASSLWLQLVADEGEIGDINMILALARADLAALAYPALLCFDEMEQLYSADADRENPEHARILAFFESLHGHATLLFIGQRALIEAAHTVELGRLTRGEMRAWLAQEGIEHGGDDLRELERYTQGNPRLLALCFALHFILNLNGPAPFAETIVRLPTTPGLAPIWERLRRRLAPAERQLLHAISVFRTVAPRSAWRSAERSNAHAIAGDTVAGDTAAGHPANRDGVEIDAVLARLQSFHLLEADGAGGIFLLPTLRVILYEEMPVEQRETLHLNAAHICQLRGEFTEAAWHLVQAQQPARALELWYQHQNGEIERGLAATALPIFEQISAHALSKAQQRRLALIRSRLYQIGGVPDRVIESLEQVDWPADDEASIEAILPWSSALDARGQTAQAHQKLEEGIARVARLWTQWTRFHVRRSIFYLQERNLAAARHEALVARMRAELLQSAIESQSGNYSAARVHGESALALADEVGDTESTSRAHYYLAIAAMHQNDTTTAFQHYEQSLATLARIGQRMQEAEVRSNLAGSYLVAGDYPNAIAQAQRALAFFEEINSSYWSAINTNNMAEAYFELGDLVQAEAFALRTMGYEETAYYPYGLHTLGSVRRKQGRGAEAQQLYAQSAQIAEENEDRFLLAHAQCGLGEVLLERGEVDAATEQLRAALALFERMGVTPGIEKTRALLHGT